jgi:hypothetical protein
MAFATGIKPLPGYPQPVGAKIMQIFDRTGPASYVQFVTPATGGDVINAADIAVGGFDRVNLGTDTTGQITATAIINLGGYANATPSVIIYYTSLVTLTLGGQAQTAGTQIVAATNLTTFSWRVEAFCV